MQIQAAEAAKLIFNGNDVSTDFFKKSGVLITE
jgi:hypothetical protein